jgi:hypothetical protein
VVPRAPSRAVTGLVRRRDGDVTHPIYVPSKSAIADLLCHGSTAKFPEAPVREARRGGDDQTGCGTPSITSRSAVRCLPLVSGPSSTEITTMTRKNIVLIIIGLAKPRFICTAR